MLKQFQIGSSRLSIESILLAMLVASLPFYLFISSLLLIVCTVVAIVGLIKHGKLGLSLVGGLSGVVVVYFVLECVGLLYTDSSNIGEGMFKLEKHLSFVMLPIIFYRLTISKEEKRWILLSFVGSCLLASIVCVVVNMYLSVRDYNTLFHQWQFSHSRLAEPIDMHPVYLSMYLCMSFFILLDMLHQPWFLITKTMQFIVVLVMVGFLVLIVQLGGRTITLGFGVIFMTMVLRNAWLKNSLRLLILALLVPALIAVLVILNPVVQTRFTDLLKNTANSNYGSYFARTNLWSPGWQVIQDNIWVGVGTGDGQAELDRQYQLDHYQDGLGMNLHNQYLETLLAGGIVGLVSMLIIFGFQLQTGLQRKDLLYIQFVILFLFGCITESMLSSNKGIVFFLLFSFIFYKSEQNDQSKTFE